MGVAPIEKKSKTAPSTTSDAAEARSRAAAAAVSQKLSNAKANAVYTSSQQYLNSSFKGVSSTNYIAPKNDGDGGSKTGTGMSKEDFNPGTVANNNGDTYVAPMPKPPTPPKATDLGVVKNPSRDVTNLANLVPQVDESTMARLLFEQFSAVEISQILTPRTIDGIDQQYSVISNLSDIRRRYDSTKQLTILDKLAPISGVYAIDITQKIPGDDYIEANNLNTEYQYLDENNELVTREKGFLYIDTNGDLIIEFDNMRDDEFIQVQIDGNGTIYEVTDL